MECTGRKRKKPRWLFERTLFLLACILLIAWQCYSRPVYLFLQTVTVVGNQKIDMAEILQMSGGLSSQGPVWFWDAKDFFDILREDLRVEEVSTVYDWPAALTIHIKERRSLAYVASQRTEGWIPVSDDYIDPGFSGGNMDRPGLKRLAGSRDRFGNSSSVPPQSPERTRIVRSED